MMDLVVVYKSKTRVGVRLTAALEHMNLSIVLNWHISNLTRNP